MTPAEILALMQARKAAQQAKETPVPQPEAPQPEAPQPEEDKPEENKPEEPAKPRRRRGRKAAE